MNLGRTELWQLNATVKMNFALLWEVYFRSSSRDPYSISWRHKLTSFGGFASGELRSTAERLLLCWVEQDGISGVETGVSPVPPSISESKLKGIPLEGVVMGTPATSEVVFMKEGVSTVLNCRDWSCRSFGSTKMGRVLGRLLLSNPTGRELGLFGLRAQMGSRFAGWINWFSTMSAFITGLMSGGEEALSRQTERWVSRMNSSSSFACFNWLISSCKVCFFCSNPSVS